MWLRRTLASGGFSRTADQDVVAFVVKNGRNFFGAAGETQLVNREAVRRQKEGVNPMLVLSRKSGERILIGENVTVTIVRIGPNNVRLGIEAPRNMNIVREELCAEVPAVKSSVDRSDETASASLEPS